MRWLLPDTADHLSADMHRSIFKFGVFNAMQSTCFDTIYHSDDNAVISAPTGAGKTALFELAILRLFASADADAKVVYIAPTKSLCSERARDWKTKFGRLGLGWGVVELTGDSRAGAGSLKDVGEARIIVTTPEKWDAMTRRWYDPRPAPLPPDSFAIGIRTLDSWPSSASSGASPLARVVGLPLEASMKSISSGSTCAAPCSRSSSRA